LHKLNGEPFVPDLNKEIGRIMWVGLKRIYLNSKLGFDCCAPFFDGAFFHDALVVVVIVIENTCVAMTPAQEANPAYQLLVFVTFSHQ
jgi:hypothetical protein